MVRKGGFELRYHVDNTQLIDSASGVKAQNPYNPVPIVRLLYDFLSAAVRRITRNSGSSIPQMRKVWSRKERPCFRKGVRVSSEWTTGEKSVLESL
jgi:hypothetical protein